jgi:DNA-binding beta-propeller fold protein YncE
VPRAIAALPDASAAWVSLNADARVALVDLRTGRVRRTLPTPDLPDAIALSPDGRRLLIAHGHSTEVTELELRHGRVVRHVAGRLPSAVAWTRNGRRLVALGGESSVAVLGARRHHVVPAPRGLAVAGRRYWTVSALTGAVHGGRA